MKNGRCIRLRVFLCFLLACAVCLGGCGTSLGSTEEESRAVLRVGGYSVPYELYRYLVMNCKNDGMSDVGEIENTVNGSLRDIYAVFAVALDYGIEFEDEYVNAVADRTADSAIAENGGKKEYKAALSENYMNDSVFRLLAKRDAMRDEIYSAILSSGEVNTERENMLAVAKSEEFICVKQILVLGENSTKVQDDTVVTPAEKHTDEEAKAIAEKARERAAEGEDFDSLVKEYGESLYMFSNTDGYYLCRGMWDAVNEEAAFSLDVGEISPVVKSSAGYSVFLRCEKSDAYMEANLDTITNNYLGALLALKIEEKAAFMDIEETEDFEGISIEDMK